MNKQTKTILGLAVLGLAGYLVWKQMKPKKSFGGCSKCKKNIGGPAKYKIPPMPHSFEPTIDPYQLQ